MSRIFQLALQDDSASTGKHHTLFEAANNDKAIYQQRLLHLAKTGEHFPLISMDAWRQAWCSVYTDQGASPDLIRMISNAISDWTPTSLLPENYASLLSAGRFSVGDRFELNLEAISAYRGYYPEPELYLPGRIFVQAVSMPPEAADVLALAWWSIKVTLPGNERLLEALVKHKRDVVAVISEPRLWKESGELNYTKVRKHLVDKVSSVFQKWHDSDIDAVVGIWRDSASRSIRVPNAIKGRSFESDIAQLFEVAGFNVELTPDSGDFGVDLIASHGDYRLAVQAKDWTASAGVDAVQQVVAGGQHYQCNDSLVISRNGFTDAAHTLARSTDTKLETIESIRRKMRNVLSSLGTTK